MSKGHSSNGVEVPPEGGASTSSLGLPPASSSGMSGASSELRIPSVSLSLSGPPSSVVVSSASGLSLRGAPNRSGGVHLVPVSSLPPPPVVGPYYKPVTITPAPSRLLPLGTGPPLRIPPSPSLRPPIKGPLSGPRTISLPYAPPPGGSPAALPVARVVPQPCLGATTMTLIPPHPGAGTGLRGDERIIGPAVSVTPVPVRASAPSEGAKMVPLKGGPPGSHAQSSVPPASSRPGILRRREGEPPRAETAASIILSANNAAATSDPHNEPREDESLSSGSTTLSATSSPGFGLANSSGGEENHPPSSAPATATAPAGSPRKKPRKQSFSKSLPVAASPASATATTASSTTQQQTLTNTNSDHLKGGDKDDDDPPKRVAKNSKKQSSACSLVLESFSKAGGSRLLGPESPAWPSRHNHFLRYSDVRVRQDRRPTVGELASHPWVSQQVEGWKLYHLSSQMEDVGSCEEELSGILNELQRRLLSSAHSEVNLSGVLEHIKANLQRSRILRDQVGESRESLLAIFEHKPRVLDIINKYVAKRPQKRPLSS